MANEYDIGDIVRLYAGDADTALTSGFTQNGTAIDPGGVVVKIKNPYGATTTYTYGTDAEVVKEATGRYRVDIAPTIHGVWAYRWEGLVSAQAAEEATFTVRNSYFD